MTLANELRADVAIALLVNRKGDPKKLLNIVKTCDLVFRRLSSEDNRSLRKQSDDLVPTYSCPATMRPTEKG